MKFTAYVTLLLIMCLSLGCSTRAIQGSFDGSTAQRLVSHSIDDLMSGLEDQNLVALSEQKVFINSYFVTDSSLKEYADKRLEVELIQRFHAQIVTTQAESDQVMTVFYTSLGTDLDNFGVSIPLGYIPSFNEGARLNLITLEKFHGISELYYYVGKTGTENRSAVLQAKVKTDALGLPFITIPLSNLNRHEEIF